MITTNTGAKKIENSDNWREIFDAHNTSVDAADRIQPEVAPIINGKQCALSVAVGNFVLLRNSTISGKADGAYEVTKAIPANTNLDSTYIANNPIGGGIANELNNNLTSLNERINKNTLNSVVDISSYNSSNNQYTIPDDGYIQLNASYATPGVEVSCRINDYLSITIQSISASSTANVVFVRKGMKVYKSTTNGTLYYFKLI